MQTFRIKKRDTQRSADSMKDVPIWAESILQTSRPFDRHTGTVQKTRKPPPPIPPTHTQTHTSLTINVPVVYMVRYKVVLMGDYP